MSFLEAIFLGILQGLTEFFPVSSSAHLEIARHLLGMENGEQSHFFDLFCHLGTLFALCLCLKNEILLFFKEKQRMLLVLAAIFPLVPCYLLLKTFQTFIGQFNFVGPLMILSSMILFLGHSFRWKEEAVTARGKIRQVMLIGLSQGAALLPGISRSGATIATARMLGWTAESAVSFSFLLSIPTILGGVFLQSLKISSSSFSLLPCLAGFFSSFLAGWVIAGFAINLLKKGHLKPFAWYCLALGIILTFYG